VFLYNLGDVNYIFRVFDEVVDFPAIEVDLGALVNDLGSIHLPGFENIRVVFNSHLLSHIHVLNHDLLFPEVGQGSVEIKQVFVLDYEVLLPARNKTSADMQTQCFYVFQLRHRRKVRVFVLYKADQCVRPDLILLKPRSVRLTEV
jgi:hypothetical protein